MKETTTWGKPSPPPAVAGETLRPPAGRRPAAGRADRPSEFACLRTRAQRKGLTEQEYVEAMSHEIEEDVEAIREIADVVMSTEQRLDELRKRISSLVPLG